MGITIKIQSMKHGEKIDDLIKEALSIEEAKFYDELGEQVLGEYAKIFEEEYNEYIIS
jgi:hypothetical protein